MERINGIPGQLKRNNTTGKQNRLPVTVSFLCWVMINSVAEFLIIFISISVHQ